MRLDPDMRFRSSYINYASTGRLRSSANSHGTGCLMPTAEALTPEGWVPISSLRSGALAMCFDVNTGQLDFGRARVNCIETNPSGRMIHADSWFHRTAYTPDHRALYKHPAASGKRRSWLVAPAEEIAKRNAVRIPVSGYWDGSINYNAIRLLVATQADGSIEGKNIRFSFKKERKIARLFALCNEFGFTPTEQKAAPGFRRFCIDVTHAASIISLLGKHKLYGSWLLDFTGPTLDAFLEEFAFWDGYRRGLSTQFSTVVKANADWAVTIAHLRGHRGSVVTDTNRRPESYGEHSASPLYKVNIKRGMFVTSEREHYSEFSYNGPVWCLTVPTTFFLMRDNGRIVITGNSNAQSIDHQARDIYVPDVIPMDRGYRNEGQPCVFLGIDLSQAEDRVVKVYTKSPRLIEMARQRPGEGIDPHTKAASIAFRKPMDQINKWPERHIGKGGRHQAHYGAKGSTFSDTLAKEGIFYTPEECQEIMDRIIREDEPEVLDWQREIRKELFQNKSRLTNSWGRTISFAGERFDDQLYHKAYAYKPQSDIGILMTQWGLIPLDATIQRGDFMPWYVAINQDGHDSLLLSVDPEVAWDVLQALRATLERPRLYDGVELIIWTEACLGSSFDMETDGVEFKRLPSKDDFIDIARAKAKEVSLS